MTDSLFDQKEQTETPQIDENQTYLDKLVGPNAKFKDPEALAKGKWYADAMIEIKNRQYDQLRNDYMLVKQELDSRAKFEDLLDQLDNKKPTTEVPQITGNPEVKTDNAPRYSQEDIENLVSQKITQTRSQEKAQENFNTVMSKLRERYGNNYQNILTEQTENLGLTVDDVNALARKSPTAFFKTMGLDQMPPQQQSQAPPRSDTRFQPQGAPKKTWSYYQDKFKKDPKLYYDPKMTQEMVESAAELGDAFQDGDFRKFGDIF